MFGRTQPTVRVGSQVYDLAEIEHHARNIEREGGPVEQGLARTILALCDKVRGNN